MTASNPVPPDPTDATPTPTAADPNPVKPLDVDGVSAAIIGTAIFAVGLVVLLIFRARLADNDATWWLWVLFAGAVMGLVGIWYTTRRRAAYRAAGRQTG